MENEKGQVVIYDGINTQAWLGEKEGKYKLSKRFKNNKLARAYAFKLSNRFKAPIYDKDYGTYIGKYSKTASAPVKKSTSGGLFGFAKPKKVKTANWVKKLLPF